MYIYYKYLYFVNKIIDLIWFVQAEYGIPAADMPDLQVMKAKLEKYDFIKVMFLKYAAMLILKLKRLKFYDNQSKTKF